MAADISKLPKWAQIEIESLRGRILALQEKLSTIAGAGATDIWVEDYSLDKNIPFPQHSKIAFRLNGVGMTEDRDVPVLHAKIGDGPWLDLSARGFGSLVIQPQSSNTVRIRLDEWWKRDAH